MEKIYKVYKITNLINNKSYIGQTCMEVEERWYYHIKTGSCFALAGAIKKYGDNNFKIEWIASSWDKFLITELENYFMEFYNSKVPNGYNINNANHIGDFTGSTLERMSASQKERAKKQSKEEKDAQYKGLHDYVNSKKRPLIGMDFDYNTIEFETTTQAENNGYHVSDSLRDQYTRCKGYVFFYKDQYTIDQMKEIIEKIKIIKKERLESRKLKLKNSLTETFKNNLDRHITAVNPETGDIKSYRNPREAILEGISSTAVHGSLKGKPLRYKGYHFFKTKDYTIEQMFEKAKETNEKIRQGFLEGRKKALENKNMQNHINSQKKPVIGVNPETLEYKIFESRSSAKKQGYYIDNFEPTPTGKPKKVNGLYFQYYTKTIEEHIEITKQLFS